MSDLDIKFVQTEDHSHTLFAEKFGEHYHSIHGSINESMHIFINAGLKQLNKKEVNVLEIGFGTGLNALLTLIEHRKLNIKVYYTSIEKYPINEDIYANLNYSKILKTSHAEFLQLHKSAWNKSIKFGAKFILRKILSDLKNVSYDSLFDLVYFDAFSPEIQPEIWTEDIFKNIYDSMSPSSILTTYCAKGEVKRILKKIGFAVQHVPGPKGKRVITRAIKNC